MSKHEDQALLEAVRTHRERLRGAFLFGSLGTRRSSATLVNRLVASVVLAAVACAGCVGVSFVSSVLEQQKARSSVVGTQPASSPPHTARIDQFPMTASTMKGSAL